jgi:hypothetical protein
MSRAKQSVGMASNKTVTVTGASQAIGAGGPAVSSKSPDFRRFQGLAGEGYFALATE